MYNFDEEINRRNTFCTQWDFTVDRFGNDDVLPFSISDMDFAIPKEIEKKLMLVMKQRVFGYTRWRHEDLLNSIGGWYNKHFNCQVKNECISYSPSVIFSICELIRIKSNAHDNVLIITPAYDAFFSLINHNNRNLISSNLIIKDQIYEIDFIDFEKKLIDAKIFILCSPHNPVGKIFSKQDLEKIANLCKKYNVFLISDEIHMDINFTKKHIPIIEIMRDINNNNFALVTSPSKSFNFPGLIFSYIIFEDLKLKKIFEDNLKFGNGLSSCSILGMHATMLFYNEGDRWLKELKEYLMKNLEYIKKELKDTNLVINQVDATYLLWIDATYYKEDFQGLINILYNEVKLGIMSGDVYGGEYFLRLNFGCNKKKLEIGIKKLKEALLIWEEK